MTHILCPNTEMTTPKHLGQANELSCMVHMPPVLPATK